MHLIERMGLEEIQYHRIADDELTIDRFRMAGESLGQYSQIDIGRRGHDGESDEIFPAATGSPSDLLHLSNRQVGEVTSFANTGLRNDDGACREIDAGGQRGGCEHGIETTGPHQLFDGDLPGRQMSCMVRGHSDALDRGYQCMFSDARVLRDHLFQDFGDHGLSSGRQKGL